MPKKGHLKLFQAMVIFSASILWSSAGGTQSSVGFSPAAAQLQAKQRLALREADMAETEETSAALLGMAMVYGGFSAEDMTKAALMVAAKQNKSEEK